MVDSISIMMPKGRLKTFLAMFWPERMGARASWLGGNSSRASVSIRIRGHSRGLSSAGVCPVS